MNNQNELSLNTLLIGEKAEVTKLKTTGNARRRMLDLGIIEGTIIEALFTSPWKDPTAYNIRGSIIAIRNEDASNIIVKRII